MKREAARKVMKEYKRKPSKNSTSQVSLAVIDPKTKKEIMPAQKINVGRNYMSYVKEMAQKEGKSVKYFFKK